MSCIPIQTQSQTVSSLTFFVGVIWIGDALKTGTFIVLYPLWKKMVVKTGNKKAWLLSSLALI